MYIRRDQVNTWNKRDDRLIQAITRRQVEKVRSLIRAGIDVTKIHPKTGLTA
jgi:ankyrin repeat protein